LQPRFDIFINVKQPKFDTFANSAHISPKVMRERNDRCSIEFKYYRGQMVDTVFALPFLQGLEVTKKLLFFVSSKEKQIIEDRFINRLQKINCDGQETER
jgi:hypothetical protein